MIIKYIKHLYPKSTCLKTREDGDFLIVQSSSMEIWYLNQVAKDFFSLAAAGHHNIETIRDILLSQYEVSMDRINEDLVSLVRDLQWKNLIVLEAHLK